MCAAQALFASGQKGNTLGRTRAGSPHRIMPPHRLLQRRHHDARSIHVDHRSCILHDPMQLFFWPALTFRE